MTTGRDTRDAALRAAIAAGYEADRVSARTIVLAGVVLAAAIALTLIVSAIFVHRGEAHYAQRGETVLREEGRRPADPVLQIDPSVDLAQLRAHEDALLRGYAWVDRGAGIARIPITEAMARVARGELAETPVEGEPQPSRPGAPVVPRDTPLPVTVGGGRAPEATGGGVQPYETGAVPDRVPEGLRAPERRDGQPGPGTTGGPR